MCLVVTSPFGIFHQPLQLLAQAPLPLLSFLLRQLSFFFFLKYQYSEILNECCNHTNDHAFGGSIFTFAVFTSATASSSFPLAKSRDLRTEGKAPIG